MVRLRFSSRLATAAVLSAIGLLPAAVALRAAPQPVSVPAPTAEGLELFEKKIRPVLAEQCFACHNSASSSPMGGLVLDSRAGVLKGGDRGHLFVPGQPEKSLLVKALKWEDRHLQMPPKGKLPAAQIADFEAWVKMGAPWPAGEKPKTSAKAGFDLKARAKHWSFQPLKRPLPPKVKLTGWVKSPVDQFLLGAMEARGLKPAPPADRRTLIRRATFDLTGLPPTPEEVETFVNDKAPNAWEKVVDRLLASPHYGERWGRHWLDLVRWAETDGHEFDFEKPNAFMYRDYVIRAFNADVPYHDFVVEHLAGDLLPKPRLNPKDGSNESIIGTGYWFLGEGKHSPVDLLEDEAERVDNQIDVTSKAFLGLSMGCARCHDHKFDPISAKDYYALWAVLKSSRYQFAAIDNPAPRQKAAQEIEAVNSQLQPQLVARTVEAQRPRLERMADYLLAARSILQSNMTAAPAPGDVVFEDFEKGYGGWKATGEAFGDRPNRLPVPSYQGELNQLGEGFLNTHSALKGDQRVVGDELTGTLTSPELTIKKPFIRFLIGGGKEKDQTCVNLLVNGKPARQANGKNANRMEWAFWDVREFIGKTAQIQVVDNATGGWGNIGLDHIVFSDFSSAYAGMVAQTAAERKLDAEALTRWVKHLRETASKNPADPFHGWARLMSARADFGRQAQELMASLRSTTELACVPADSTPLEDFDGPDYKGWFVTGEAFGAGPTPAALPRMDGAKVERVVEAGVADSGRISDRLQGTLRSRTFTADKDHVLIRMAGKDATVRLILDSFQRIRNPIYGGLEIKVNDPKPRWYKIEVGKWGKGHRGYLELLDEGRGYIQVDRILLADGDAPAASPIPAAVRLLDGAGSAEELAKRYQQLFLDTANAWAGGKMPGDEASAELVNWMLTLDPAAPGDPAMNEMANRRSTLENAVPEPRRVMAMADGTPEAHHVYLRGSHKNLGDEVPRRYLEMFAGTAPIKAEGSGRLALANKMVNGPLLPRVWVNRVWRHHFGEGIVATPDDFGLRGEKPTHPELLEWLTSEFIRMGWSTKKLHRLLLLSSAYRMASKGDAASEAADPANKLLHRMPVKRLEAEAIRDSILAVSGRLDRTLFGPSVLPHLTPFMEGRGRPSTSGPLDGAGRRSIYISVRRNFLTPMFLAFDYPIPFNTMGRRMVSTVPSQALVLMNNPFVVEQAGVWGKRVAEDKGTARERVMKMYQTAFSRPPTEPELAQALSFLEEEKRRYPSDAETRAWSDLGHVLINLKEFIFVN